MGGVRIIRHHQDGGGSWDDSLDIPDLEYLTKDEHPFDRPAGREPAADTACVFIDPGNPDQQDHLFRSIAELRRVKPDGLEFTFSERSVLDPLESNQRLVVLGTLSEPKGFARIRITGQGIELGLIEVFQHGQGHGPALIEFLKDKFPHITALDSEVKLVPFYEKLGFAPVQADPHSGGINLVWSR